MEWTDDVEEYLASEGYDPVYGVRPLKRAIQNRVLNALSPELLEGEEREGQEIRAFNPESEVQRQTVGAMLWCARAGGPEAGCIPRCCPEGRKPLGDKWWCRMAAINFGFRVQWKAGGWHSPRRKCDP